VHASLSSMTKAQWVTKKKGEKIEKQIILENQF
jgi:hypothetical protein